MILSIPVAELLKEVAVIDYKYGYLKLNRDHLLEQPTPVVRRVLGALLKYISGDINPVSYKHLETVVSCLPHLNKATTVHRCLVFPLPQRRQVGICGTIMFPNTKIPIGTGESIHWKGRWKIHLTSLAKATSQHQYYIRHFESEDNAVLKWGLRAIRGRKLPPLVTRRTLPVIVDEGGKVVLIPHFKYADRRYGIIAEVKYQPIFSLDSVVNQH